MRSQLSLLLLVFLSFQQVVHAQVYLPNHRTTTQKNTGLKSYYTYWKNKYLKPSNGVTPGGGYYVEMFGPGGVGSEGHKTTSEAMGYGMLITVMAAKIDPQAKMYFDGLYNMYRKHPSIHSKYLMSWVIHKSEKTSYDSASATDGDFDIALALIFADKTWGSTGAINYKLQAQLILGEILKKTINLNNNKIMLGDWWHSTWSETSRPSDWMGGHMIHFNRFTNDQRYLNVRNKIYSMAKTLQDTHSPSTGLIPDFVTTSQSKPAPAYTLEGPYDGHYYYNSARVPLRFVVDYQMSSAPQIKTILQKMVSFFYRTSNRNPSSIRSGHKLSGEVIGQYFDTTFVAPVIAAATVDPQYQSFVNSGWDLLLQQKSNYFADSINMLSLYYLNNNWPR